MRLREVCAALLLLSGCGDDGDQDGARPPCERLCTPPSLSRLDLLAGQPGGPGFVDGPSPSAHFSGPWGVAHDGAGHLYVADGGNTVRVVDLAAGVVSTLAGSPDVNGGADGTGAAASFYGMTNVVAKGGVVYVSDTENHTLRRIDAATGAVTTLTGAYDKGGATDGALLDARFQEPEGLALDGTSLYVGDTDNHTVRRVDLVAGMVTTIAGAARMPGATDATGAAARFNKPKAVAADGAGRLFVADSGNKSLRQVALADGKVTTLAVFEVEPQGATVIGGDVLVSLADHRVVRVAIAGGAVTALCGKAGESGFVDGPAADARFYFPIGLAGDGAGALYLAEGNFAVRKVDLGALVVSTVAGARSSGSSDGPGGAARFRGPSGIAADGAGALYVADTSNYTLRKVIVATGETTTLAGAAGQAGLADGAGAAARFDLPTGLVLDGAGHLYVADSGNRVIRVVDLASAAVSTLGGVRLRTPADLALDGGRLFVSDREDHTVRAIDLATLEVTVLAGRPLTPGRVDGAGDAARFNTPAGLVADGAGGLYVADVFNQALRKIDIATGQVTTLAGAGAPGGDSAGFAYPSYLALNGLGDLYVSDVNNNTVRHVATDSGAVTTVIGDPKRSGVKLGPLPGQLASLRGLALTPDGHLALLAEDSVLLAR